jgi:hypothetical protein
LPGFSPTPPWKALDPGYITEAQWIVDFILKPLHPLAVWLVSAVMPPLRTLVSNMPPTHLDADKVLYGFLVPIYMGVILGIFRLARWAEKQARVVSEGSDGGGAMAGWVSGIGLDLLKYAAHSMRRTETTPTYRRTANLKAVQISLGHTRIESTVRYLGVGIDDALAIAEKIQV